MYNDDGGVIEVTRLLLSRNGYKMYNTVVRFIIQNREGVAVPKERNSEIDNVVPVS